MVHPVKTPLGVVRGATRISLNAVRHPLQTAGDALTVGRSLVGAAVTGHRDGPTPPRVEVERPHAEQPHAEQPHAEPVPEPAKKQGDPVAPPTTTPEESTEQPASTEPADVADTAVIAEPEPVDDAIVTEPSAVTGPGDDDEIPSPAVQPVDEDIEVITPVGTTGAGHAVNPDTTESDLQQPGTEPLMDPSTTKRIKKETDTLRKASDRKK